MNSKNNETTTKKPKIWFLLIIILFIILATGAILFTITQRKNQTVSTTPNSPTAPTSSNSSSTAKTLTSNINTSNWKTYTNTTYGYELKYPPEFWKVEVIKALGETEATSPNPTLEHLCQSDVYCGSLGIQSKKERYEPNAKLEDYFVILDLNEVLSRKYITIGGERAYRVEFTRVYQSGKISPPAVFIYLVHNQTLYMFSHMSNISEEIGKTDPDEIVQQKKPEDTLKFPDVINAMLASFKFND